VARIPELEALTEGAVQRLRADIERVIERLAAYLREAAAGLGTEEGRLSDSPSNVELASKLAGDLGRVLSDLGYDQAVGRLLDDLEAANDLIAGATGDTLGVSYTAASQTSLAAFAVGVVDELLAVKGQAADRLREVLLLGLRTHLPLDRELSDLAEALGVTIRQAANLAETSLMAFQREALVSQAEEAGIDLFVYEGPDDGLTRPFCAEHVDRIYTQGDLDAEENGQGLEPTSRYLGGFRCRHYLSPITVDEAQAMARSSPRIVGGPEARAILGGRVGAAEERFVEAFRGEVVVRGGRHQVVRRRAA
jgi:hypothetical protein